MSENKFKDIIKDDTIQYVLGGIWAISYLWVFTPRAIMQITGLVTKCRL